MRTTHKAGRPRTRTVGMHDFYRLFDGNRTMATSLMLPAGTRIRRVEAA